MGVRLPDWGMQDEPCMALLAADISSSGQSHSHLTTVHKQGSLPCLVFLAPHPVLWILILGWGAHRFPGPRRRGSRFVSSCFVSILSFRVPPAPFAFFPRAARLSGQPYLSYTESTLHVISLKWRGRDPRRSGRWIMPVRAPRAAVGRGMGHLGEDDFW
jgi:hypothetical protein